MYVFVRVFTYIYSYKKKNICIYVFILYYIKLYLYFIHRRKSIFHNLLLLDEICSFCFFLNFISQSLIYYNK